MKSNYGFIDRTGKVVIELNYEMAGKFSEGLAFVSLNGKQGFIDRSARMIIELPVGTNTSLTHFSDGLAAVGFIDDRGTHRAAGYIDKTGKLVIEPQQGFGNPFSEGLAVVLSGTSVWNESYTHNRHYRE